MGENLQGNVGIVSQQRVAVAYGKPVVQNLQGNVGIVSQENKS